MPYANGKTTSTQDTITRVVCDKCANAGAVPFKTIVMPWSGGTERIQEHPWTWFPLYGGKCDQCGANC